MPTRALTITALTLTILGTLYILYSPTSPTYLRLPKMSSPSPLPLKITLSPISHSPPSILVTLKNTSPSQTYTLLTWSTPLDPQALNLGLFHFKNLDTGEELEVPKLMVNRLLPAKKEDLEEVGPGKEVRREVVLQRPWMPKEGRWGVWVEGSWRGVWEKNKGEITEEDVEGGGIELSEETGNFKSGEVVLDLGGK